MGKGLLFIKVGFPQGTPKYLLETASFNKLQQEEGHSLAWELKRAVVGPAILPDGLPFPGWMGWVV